jgi:peptidoglycan/xylan/chitin deacetylase (PgdA/CDA1 family)
MPTVKEIVKKLLCLFIYALTMPLRKKRASGLLVVTYHRISEEPDPDDPLKVSADTFEKQMIYLKNSYSLLSAHDLVQILQGAAALPPKACLITFDDGWKDNYIHAFPILKKQGIPALIFISSDYIGTGKIFWHERLKNILLHNEVTKDQIDGLLSEWPSSITALMAEMVSCSSHDKLKLILDLTERLKQFPETRIELLLKQIDPENQYAEDASLMLSWEETLEMSRNGIAFGSHAKSHGILTLMSEKEVKLESEVSKDIIEKRFSETAYFFAYPNGDLNDTISNIVRSTGYLAAFTCIPGLNYLSKDTFNLKRSNMRENSSDFLGRFSSLFYAVELSGVRLRFKDLLRKWRHG